jgi:hypothetical protein
VCIETDSKLMSRPCSYSYYTQGGKVWPPILKQAATTQQNSIEPRSREARLFCTFVFVRSGLSESKDLES